MKAARFDYESPRSLDQALALLARHPEATLLAGGQSLGPLLNLRMAQPTLLVDVRRLPELRQCREEHDDVILGACVTHAMIEDGQVPDPTGGRLPAIARGIAYRAVRNRGTLGGSLAHADPAADWVSVMAMLDAAVLVRSERGERAAPAATFVTGPLTTRLAAGEMIVGVRVPKLGAGARLGYCKINRKPGEFADAIGAVLDDPARGIRRAVIGATSGAPFVLPEASLLLSRDMDWIEANVAAAGFDAGSYEHRVHAVALRRAREALR